MENINVALRSRPLNSKEIMNDEEAMWLISKGRSIKPNPLVVQNRELVMMKAKNKVKFAFDDCFDGQVNNMSMYQKSVRGLVLSSFQGINGTVFMYGQTGAGKTYSMLGSHKYQTTENENTEQEQSTQNLTNQPSQISINQSEKQRYKSPISSKNQFSQKTLKKRSISPISSALKQPTYRHSRQGSHVENINRQNMQQQQQQQQLLQQQQQQQQQQQEPQQIQAEEKQVVIQNTFDLNMINDDSGILVLSLKDIFQKIQEDNEKTYMLTCEYVEIYNDKIYDLLTNQDQLDQQLFINEDSQKKEFYIKNVTQKSVNNINEILYYLQTGEQNRSYAATKMNHNSSRSHTIFRLNLKSITSNHIKNEIQKQMDQSPEKRQSNVNNADMLRYIQSLDVSDSDSDGEGDQKQGMVVTQSLLNFVDLAGSEKVSNHYQGNAKVDSDPFDVNTIENQEEQLVKNRVKEGQHINSSLFFLTLVIQLKSSGKSQHIPYRNSPLTKILRSSLGGNSRTLIVLCITPAHTQFEQTMSTLRFGANAKTIQNKITANVQSQGDSEAYKYLVNEYEQKFKKQDIQLAQDQEIIRDLTQDLAQAQKLIGQLQKENSVLEQDNNRLKEQLVQQEADMIRMSHQQQKKCQDMETQAKEEKKMIQELNNIQVQHSCDHQVLDLEQYLKELDSDVLSEKVGLVSINKKRKKEMVQYNFIRPRLKANWQDTLFDAEGRILLQAYQKSKTNNQHYVTLINQQASFIQTLNDQVKNYFTQKEEAKIYINQMQDQLEDFYDQYDSVYDKYVLLVKQLNIYRDQSNLDVLEHKDLEDLSVKLMEGFKKVVEQQVMRKVNKTVNPIRKESSDDEIEVDIELIEKIQIDANYKIENMIQQYAQQVKVNIHQLHSQNTFRAKQLTDQLDDPSLALSMQELNQIDNTFITNLLSTWDQPVKCHQLYKELPQPQQEQQKQQQSTQPTPQETFIIKNDVSDCNPQITEVMQDFSLINKNRENKDESDRDISQYFREDIKELLDENNKGGNTSTMSMKDNHRPIGMQRTGGFNDLHSRKNLNETLNQPQPQTQNNRIPTNQDQKDKFNQYSYKQSSFYKK